MLRWKQQKMKIRSFLIATVILIGSVFGAASSARAAIAEWQQGMTLHLNNQDEADVAASLDQLARTGVNFVALSPGYITDSKTSSNVDRKPGTPSDAILIFAIRKAHALGLDVMLKPHLDIKGGNWRAFLRPDDTRLFFENYSRMMLQYADIAQASDVHGSTQ
jgi:hypothetical protein